MSEIVEYDGEMDNLPSNQPTLPVVDIQAVKDYWDSYKELTDVLLDQSDYQLDKRSGKRFKKKSAWRKYATAFNFTTKIIDEKLTYDDEGRIITAKYIVLAIAPNGRSEPGVGACSIWDKAHEGDKLNDKGKIICKGPCNGRKHYSSPENDIVTTAHTRAKSRAIADLIGTGEVSAEEIDFNTGNGNKPAPQGNGGRQRQTTRTRDTTRRTRTTNTATKPKEPEFDANMPKAEKVQNPEPDNTVDGEISPELNTDQIFSGCPKGLQVAQAVRDDEKPLTKKNINNKAVSMMPEHLTADDLKEINQCIEESEGAS